MTSLFSRETKWTVDDEMLESEGFGLVNFSCMKHIKHIKDWFCLKGDVLFWTLLKVFLGIMFLFFARLFKQIQGDIHVLIRVASSFGWS